MLLYSAFYILNFNIQNTRTHQQRKLSVPGKRQWWRALHTALLHSASIEILFSQLITVMVHYEIWVSSNQHLLLQFFKCSPAYKNQLERAIISNMFECLPVRIDLPEHVVMTFLCPCVPDWIRQLHRDQVWGACKQHYKSYLCLVWKKSSPSRSACSSLGQDTCTHPYVGPPNHIPWHVCWENNSY